MASMTLKSIQTALDLLESKKENLRKAFEELQSHSYLLSSFAFTWNDIKSYVESTQSDLLQKFSSLQAQESLKIRKAKMVKIYASSGSLPARPELKSLCENMDGLGLRKYVLDRPRERTAIRVELADALKHASDPGSMILDALDGFCGAGSDSGTGSELGALRRACAVLLEEFLRVGFEIGAEVKERAAAIAAEWKGWMSSVSDGNGGDEDEEKKEETGGLDKLIYLQLLAAYKLVNDGGYDANELINDVVMIARCRQAVELCQAIGLESRVSDVVQKLMDKGKQLLALKFIFEFELIDEFPPVPLLKAYVNNSEKLSQKVRKSGKGSRQSLNEVATKEINALKAVIKCIEDHSLESQYPKSVLVKRIEKLEKEKGDRKRAAPAATPKPQQNLRRPPQTGNKRMRAATGRKFPAKPVIPLPQPSLVQRSEVEMQDVFTKKEAEAKAAKRAARKAAADKKVREKRDAEARATTEGGESSIPPGAPKLVTTEARAEPMIEIEGGSASPDHVPLNHRKRKAPADPTMIEVREESPVVQEPNLPPPSISSGSPRVPDLLAPSPSVTPESIFSTGSLGMGFRLLQQITSPAEETFLRSLNLGDQMLESLNLGVACMQMAKSAYEKLALAQRQFERRAASSKTICDQAQAELVRLREAHAAAMAGKEIVVSVLQEQLGEARRQGVTLRAQLVEASARVEALDLNTQSATDEARLANERADELSAALAARTQTEAEWKTSFLASPEFQALVADKAFPWFKTGFRKCRDQIKEAGLLLPEKKSLLDFSKAIASLPPEGSVEPEESESDDEGASETEHID